MEGIALLGMVIVIVVVLAYYGVFGSLEIASDMANRELRDAARKQKQRIVKTYKDVELHEDQWKAATDNINKLDNLQL